MLTEPSILHIYNIICLHLACKIWEFFLPNRLKPPYSKSMIHKMSTIFLWVLPVLLTRILQEKVGVFLSQACFLMITELLNILK